MKITHVEEFNIHSMLNIAERNQMSYYFAKKISEIYKNKLNEKDELLLNNVKEIHNSRFIRMQNALRAVDNVLSEYLVIKSYYGFPRVGSDIDIYTHDFERTRKIFNQNGFRQIEAKDQKALFLINDFKIHLHRKVSWANETTTFIDDNLIWRDPRTVTIGDIAVVTPNINADLLMHLAHFNFECFQITLANIFYFLNNIKYADWSIILEQARKHNWERALKSSIRLIDTFYHTFYSTDCPLKEFEVDHSGEKSFKKISLPIIIPRSILLKAIIDKGLFVWAITERTSMSVRMLFKGH